MPIPTCHLARTEVVYTADDGQKYRLKVEDATRGLAQTMQPPTSGESSLPYLPKSIKPRHFFIATTNGVDAQGRYHVYRRSIICAPEDVAFGAAGWDGTQLNGYEGCNWITRGYVMEKTYDR